MVDKKMVESFQHLFRGREDARGTMKGSCIRGKVTVDHYRQHLDGKISLGIYPLLDDDTCHFFAIDLDEKNFEKAKAIRLELNNIFIPAYITNSRQKGYHIYGFADYKFKAKEIRLILTNTLKKLGIKAEIFPKQDIVRPETPLGNYINLPCYGFTRQFLTTSMKEVKPEDALEKIKYTPQESIEKALQALPRKGYSKEQPIPLKNHPGVRLNEEYNPETIEELFEYCAFIQHCQDDASTLSEPHWWSMVTILIVWGKPGIEKMVKFAFG